MNESVDMAQVLTKYFGWMEIPEETALEFPAGLPGFDQERCFVCVRNERHLPVVFLQSLKTPDLCFLAVPVGEVDQSYSLELAVEDRRLLGLGETAPPEGNLEALALLSVREGEGASANLLAPIVVNPVNRRAVQAVRRDRRYSSRVALCRQGSEAPACS